VTSIPPNQNPSERASSSSPIVHELGPWQLARDAIGGAITVSTALIRAIFDWKALLIVCATLSFYVWLLPPAERVNLRAIREFASALAQFVESSFFSLLGWILFILTLAVSSAAFYMQDRRIRMQGTQNARLREKFDHERLSAADREALQNYESMAKKKFPPGDSQ
jgi:hypothetical protein